MSQLANKAKKQLLEFQDVINPYINDYFSKKRQEVRKVNKRLEDFICVIEDFIKRGGKRVRPSLAYYSYKMFGGEDEKAILQLGLSLEILHASLLLFDDFMDLSEKRRGAPTAHVMFANLYDQKKYSGYDKKHFGYSAEVNAGTTASFLAFETINSINIPSKIKSLLIDNLAKKIEYTTYGQFLDITNPLERETCEQDIFDMFMLKTAMYTFENPLHLGAILAKASSDSLRKLSEYALPAGIAFQIQDDILGVFGESSTTGKLNMDDIREGKYTLLAHFALKNGTKKQAKILKQSLGNKNLTREQFEEVKEIFIETKSLDHSREVAEKYTRCALESLDKNFAPGSQKWQIEGYKYLRGLAKYSVERTS